MNAIPLTLIFIEPDGFHLMLHAFINGYKANVLIDTGASKTIMDLSRAQYYLDNPDIKPFNKFFTGVGAGRIKTYVTFIPKIVIGNKELLGLDIVLIDMAPLNASYAVYDLPRIDMVLGGDLLVMMKAVIDYPNKQLVFGKGT